MQAWKLFRPNGAPTWHVLWTDARGAHCLDTGSSDAGSASNIARQLVAAASDPAGISPHTPAISAHTVYDAIDRLAEVGLLDNAQGTVECYQQRGGHVVRLLGALPVDALTLDVLHEYIANRLNEGAARETIRKELTVLRQALKLARKRGLFLWDPSDLFPDFEARYTPRTGWLTPAQVDLLLGKLEPHRQRWVLVAVYTGARRSELERIDWRDLDFGKGELRIRGTKTAGSVRSVPIHPRLLASLQPRAVRGHLVRPWPNLGRDLPLACKAAQVPRVTANDLRRTFASWLVQAGESNFVVSRLLGHTTTKMVDLVYGQLTAETLRTAISKLPGAP